MALGAPRPASAAEPTGGRVLVTQAALGALASLPASANAQPLSAFYERYRPYLEAHSFTNKPRERRDPDEKSQNFIDLDALGTAPAFADIPHDQDAAVTKFGRPKMRASGTAPWALGQHYQQLVYAFQDRDLPAILLHSARLDVFTYDLHQPFHVTKNYDGMETGQYGIHNRFEGLPEQRKMTVADLTPGVPAVINNVPEAGFTWATQSWGQVAAILDADKAARKAPGDAATGASQEDLFAAKARPITQTQLSQAATDLASLYYSAWEQAGRPPLPDEINPVKPPAKSLK